MAISEMSVMSLVGLNSDKDKLLDAFQKTGAVQVKATESCEAFTETAETADTAEVAEKLERTERAITLITDTANDLGVKTAQKDGFGVTLDEFFAIREKEPEILRVIGETEAVSQELLSCRAERAKLKAVYKSFAPYSCVKSPFSAYLDTKSTAVWLGIAVTEKTRELYDALGKIEGCVYEECGTDNAGTVVAVVALKEKRQETEQVLSASGFVKCNCKESFTAAEKLAETEKAEQSLTERENSLLAELAKKAETVRDLKIYADHLSFIKEKRETEGRFRETEKTFLLEAYVPTEAADRVKKTAESVSGAVYTEFHPIDRKEYAPTLMKNKKAVENFEFVTNMYSAPAYGALDPNGVMAFFFSLFMGVIMADFGYGLFMLVGGLIFAKMKMKGSSIYRMAKVFAYGGIFAMLFGALFDSWMGFPLLRTLFGEGSAYNTFYAAHLDSISATVSLSGINIPAMLLWCLGLGTVHIAVGLILKAVQSFGRRNYLDAIFGGLVWAFALLSAVVWIFCVVKELAFGSYMMYATVALFGIGILTAGIQEKGFGKVTKVFTSAYGLINYVSDILSYARLYGLMLSGAQIASIFTNTLAIGLLFPKGIVGIILGVILILFGNVFNLAISLLGAYIHDSRLQYVEFFGKFYEGEGDLFTPLGRTASHIVFSHE